MKTLNDLKIQIYADGADKTGISIFTPTLHQGTDDQSEPDEKAGIKDTRLFCQGHPADGHRQPISLEVFTDDIADMKRQALKITAWPPMFTPRSRSPIPRASPPPACQELGQQGVKLNITAILTLRRCAASPKAHPKVRLCVSFFAGRIADTGVDPMPIMRASGVLLEGQPKAELLWASTREF